MKNSLFVLFGSLLLLFATANTSHAQVISPSAPILTGCVGACGNSFYGTATAPASRVYKFKAVSSLCPSHEGSAAIFVDGNLVWSGRIDNGAEAKFEAKMGHQIVVVAGINFVNPLVQCVWLGEVNFAVL